MWGTVCLAQSQFLSARIGNLPSKAAFWFSCTTGLFITLYRLWHIHLYVRRGKWKHELQDMSLKSEKCVLWLWWYEQRRWNYLCMRQILIYFLLPFATYIWKTILVRMSRFSCDDWTEICFEIGKFRVPWTKVALRVVSYCKYIVNLLKQKSFSLMSSRANTDGRTALQDCLVKFQAILSCVSETVKWTILILLRAIASSNSFVD